MIREEIIKELQEAIEKAIHQIWQKGDDMELSLILGILSLVIAIIAIGIAIKSDRMMKSIANFEYDEKLAIMASHLERIKTDKTLGKSEN